MAQTTIVSGQFNSDFPYIDDRGFTRFKSVKTIIPKHMENSSVSIMAGIMLAGGAEVRRVGGTPIGDNLDLPCPDNDVFQPRRLIFIFADNSSMSVPISGREERDYVATANSIITNIGSATQTSVVCVKLVGESFVTLFDEFEDAEFRNQPVQQQLASRYYSGLANFQPDAPFNSSLLLPVKIKSEDNYPNRPTQAPEFLREAWDNCIGELNQNNISCGNRQSRYNHRRYFVKVLVDSSLSGSNNSPVTEEHEVPITSRTPAQVLSCGQSIVSTIGSSIVCLGYEGWSDNRFHKIPGVEVVNIN